VPVCDRAMNVQGEEGGAPGGVLGTGSVKDIVSEPVLMSLSLPVLPPLLLGIVRVDNGILVIDVPGSVEVLLGTMDKGKVGGRAEKLELVDEIGRRGPGPPSSWATMVSQSTVVIPYLNKLKPRPLRAGVVLGRV